MNGCNFLFTRCKVYTLNLQILTRFRNYTIVSQSQILKIVNSNHLVWLPIQCSDQLNPVSQYTSSILILANLTREIDFCLEMAFMHLLQVIHKSTLCLYLCAILPNLDVLFIRTLVGTLSPWNIGLSYNLDYNNLWIL